ncbi:type IV secretion system protein VirB8 [Luteibacter sp. OK325]|jgi:type IV secretion system protein VirB8|uniref:virB8 family protein n=1 Tax=Luteibacter sp. OK325 TaxID=2135670 RepID=UPI000D332B19|nr:type IV secretion system protein [Luteibacter sp. OK325]PTR33084.1 type IV secretion system protein VirB8 [Luteibacter sp. OK325]
MLKKKQSPKIDATVSQSVSFEVTVMDQARLSARRAWIVTYCSVALTIMMGGIIFYMMPLKEKIPFVVLVDPYSGTSSISRLRDDVLDQRITSSESVNRSNIAHFVLAREAYDLAITNMRDWPTVMTMAAPDVAGPYMRLHSAGNENSPFKTYGKVKAIRVKILSIVLIGGGQGGTPKGATVRFQRTVYDKTTGAATPLDSKIATMEFVYKANLRMDDQSRVENPLGFQVTSYRVDNDFGSAPPVEVPTNVDPAAPPAAAAPTATLDPDDMPAPVNGQAVPPVQPSAVIQSSAIPASPIPLESSYPAPQPAGATGPASTNAAPAARSARSAANGGRR